MNIPKLLANRYGKLKLVFRCIFYAKTVLRTHNALKNNSPVQNRSTRFLLYLIYHSLLEGLTDISRYICQMYRVVIS